MVSVSMPPALSSDRDRSGFHGDRDHRRDLGFLTSIERVVHQLLEHDQRPIMDAVPGLILQFAPGAELHQPRDPEGHAGQFRRRLCTWIPLGLCHNL